LRAAGIRAELGEHPSITAKQIGHRDERMTLRIYTDVTGVRPKTRMAGLLDEDGEWTGTTVTPLLAPQQSTRAAPPNASIPLSERDSWSASDRTRTGDLRRDRPAF
jgi:hypothetical protein